MLLVATENCNCCSALICVCVHGNRLLPTGPVASHVVGIKEQLANVTLHQNKSSPPPCPVIHVPGYGYGHGHHKSREVVQPHLLYLVHANRQNLTVGTTILQSTHML